MNVSTSILVVAALCSGCATVGGREQLVSIDSVPRGAAVVDRDGNAQGTTPAFVRQARDASAVYDVRFVDGRVVHVDVDCGARAGFVFADALPGLPLLTIPLFGVLSYVALTTAVAGVDAADGAFYECPAAVRVADSVVTGAGSDLVVERDWRELPAFSATGCPRFLVVPPLAPHAPASAATSTQAAQALLAQTPCATAVEPSTSAETFEHKRVSFHAPLHRARFVREDFADVAAATGASHVVVVEAIDGDPATVRLHIIDAHSLVEAKGPVVVVGDVAAAPDGDLVHDALSAVAGLVPDTFVWNAAAKAFPYESTRGERIVAKDFTYPLLSSSINFQLYHLDTPVEHPAYDVTFGVAPDVVFQLNGQRMTLVDDDGDQRELTLTVIQLVVPVSARTAFFTPAGVTAVWAGVGPGFVLDWDEPAFHATTSANLFAHGGVSHSVFLTRSLFVGAAAQANRSAWAHVERDGVKLDWFFQANLNLGISMPDLSADLRSWIP